jgi:hypothetical protein
VGRLRPCLKQTLLALTKMPLTPCSRRALVLQRLTLGSPRTPERHCSLVKRPSPHETARFPMSKSRRIKGAHRRPKVSMERGVMRKAPHLSWQYCARFSVSLCATATPGVAAAARRYRVVPGWTPGWTGTSPTWSSFVITKRMSPRAAGRRGAALWRM